MANQGLGREPAHLQEDDEHLIPTVTLPQGTQEHGVDHGHEQRDIQVPALVRWFGGLAIVTALLMAIMGAAFWGMQRREAAGDVPPSPIFTQRQQPPRPRLLPNPVDDPPEAHAAPIGPIEYHAEQKMLEDQELAKVGLIDPKSGRPNIPRKAAESVLNSQAGQLPPSTGGQRIPEWSQSSPSDSSGGTSTEDYLR